MAQKKKNPVKEYIRVINQVSREHVKLYEMTTKQTVKLLLEANRLLEKELSRVKHS